MAHLPRPRRRLRRRERARRRRFLVGAIVTSFLIVASLVLLPIVSGGVSDPAAKLDTVLAVATEPVAEADVNPDRPIYPYSIIPGGAPTVEALEQAMATDPVVRAHYSNFDLTRTRVVRLTHPRVAHVSYRIGSNVFWTHRPLILKVGETLLTDGEHYARTRCGNQLAQSPGAVSADEPAPQAFDTPLPQRQGAAAFPRVVLPAPGADTRSTGGPTATSGGTPFPGGTTPIAPGFLDRTATGGLRSTLLDPGSGRKAVSPLPSDIPASAAAGPSAFTTTVGSGSPAPNARTPGSGPTFVDEPPQDLSGPDPPDDPAIAQVPEPSIVLLVLTGGGLCLRYRHRTRNSTL